jgi:hypothetical protein
VFRATLMDPFVPAPAALGSTQSPTEMSTRNLPASKGRSAHKADLTALCEPIVRKCRSLDVSQTYGPPRPVTGIALPSPLTPPCPVLVIHERVGCGRKLSQHTVPTFSLKIDEFIVDY